MTSTYDEALRKVSDDITARARAADDLVKAFLLVRSDLEPSGWVLVDNRAPPQREHFLVGFTMRRDGQDVEQCVFKVGPGRLVQFEGRGEPNFTGSVDDMGEADFHRLLESWAGTVQAMRFKRPLLRAGDGAKFYGRVDAIQDGLWRAACHAMQDQGGSTLMEQPDSQVFATKAEGRAWIMELAARRGFTTWVNETPGDPPAAQ